MHILNQRRSELYFSRLPMHSVLGNRAIVLGNRAITAVLTPRLPQYRRKTTAATTLLLLLSILLLILYDDDTREIRNNEIRMRQRARVQRRYSIVHGGLMTLLHPSTTTTTFDPFGASYVLIVTGRRALPVVSPLVSSVCVK